MKTALLQNTALPTPALHRWLLAGVMLTVLALGWKYPLLGFIVPVAMLGGMLGGAQRGRYVCGNLCPRGSFFDTFFAKFGPKREIPEKLFGLPLRWTLMAGLMGFMVFRLAQNLSSLEHWGLVFWQMCLVTTAAALVLGVLYRPRTWCAVCPVGTVGSATGGMKMQLSVAASCRSCSLCEKNCPMGLQITDFKEQGAMNHPDCLQCSTCVHVCPVSALTLEKAEKAQPQQLVEPADDADELKKAA